MLRMCKKGALRSLLPILLVATFAICLTAESAEISGRLSSSVYGFEQSEESHWRPYLGMDATASLWRQSSRSLTLHTNLRWTSDFSTKEANDPQTYVYDLYVELTGYPSRGRVYAGRQFVYSSIGSALIDGIRLKQKLSESFNLDLYGGAPVAHQSPEKVQSLSDRASLGGRLGYQKSDVRFGLNWLWRRSGGSTSQHRAGMDGQWLARRAELYARAVYDLSNMAISGALGRVVVRPGQWTVSAEFDWRRPSVESNSIFSVVAADAYQGVRTDLTYKLPKGLSAIGQVHWELMPGEDSWRTMLGLRSGAIMLGWTHRDGYGGISNGLSGNATLRISDRVETYVTACLSQYKIQPEPPDRMDAYSSSFGAIWKPGSDIRVRAEGQYLRNAVEASDWRVFLQITKGFSLGSHEAEAGK